jgi:hypothetical protein
MGIREFTESRRGKQSAALLLVVAIGILLVSIRGNLGQSEAASTSRTGYFICTETGKTFQYQLSEGDTVPVMSPYSGSKTGIMGELCYWNVDGSIGETPTVVLHNSDARKAGPTFCPTCDRLVAKDNPPPVPNYAPVKRSEYRAN